MDNTLDLTNAKIERYIQLYKMNKKTVLNCLRIINKANSNIHTLKSKQSNIVHIILNMFSTTKLSTRIYNENDVKEDAIDLLTLTSKTQIQIKVRLRELIKQKTL